MNSTEERVARELLKLAKRCEAATAEQQRDLLDAAFATVHGPKPPRLHGGSQEMTDWLNLHNPFFKMLEAKAFESAAMTLVPEGWFLQHGLSEFNQRSWHCSMRSEVRDFGGRAGRRFAASKAPCATPALALAAAALRAIAQTEVPNDR